MTHGRFEEMLARRGELSPAEEARLQAHLRDCPQCRDTAAAYEQQTHLLRSLQPIEPPPALRAGVLDGIRDLPPPRPWWSPRPIFLLGPAAAVFLVVGASAMYNLNPGGSGTSAALPAPTVPTTARTHLGVSSPTRKLTHVVPTARPAHAGTRHPQGHSPSPQHGAPSPAPTSAPVESAPGIALGPPPAVPTPNTNPAPVQAAQTTGVTPQPSPSQPVKEAASHPIATSPPAAKPPVVVAPTRPTVVPVVPTPAPTTAAPTTVATITTAAPAAPPTLQPFPSPTAAPTVRP